MHIDVDPRLDPKPYYATAFAVGVLAAGVMTLLLWVARGAGLTQLNLAMSLGTVTGATLGDSPGAWFEGFLAMLTCGGLFALVYAWVFEEWPHHAARAWLGATIGIVHSLIGGLLLAVLMPPMHPGPAPTDNPLVGDPGFMGVHYGVATVWVFMALHVVYGAMIGGWMHASPLANRYLRAFAERRHARALAHR
jgi:hypothetical protein